MPDYAQTIRILCVDDHRIVREGLTLIIEREPDMQVVAYAAAASDAVGQFAACAPDVTLMDLQLGATSGIDAIRQIRAAAPEARIVALTMHQGEEDMYRAVEAGAAAYLLKDTLSHDLIRVIRLVHAGQPAVGADVLARLAQRATRRPLTPRETEVLELVAQGMRNREIALSLGVSEETVQAHVKNILGKLQVKDRTGAVSVALQRGIIHLRNV